MIGFCLAAGAGTRLLPLTRLTPKPLLAPAGRPLVDLAIEALQAAGATRVVVNAHHGADLLAAHLAGRPGVEVLVEPTLLGTGGGLANAAHRGRLGRGDDPVLVTAADHVVTPADLAALARFLDRSRVPMAAGLVPGPTSFPLRLDGTRLARDPAGGWDSAGAYVVRAGLLCELEPGPASLVERVLGPLLERWPTPGPWSGCCRRRPGCSAAAGRTRCPRASSAGVPETGRCWWSRGPRPTRRPCSPARWSWTPAPGSGPARS